MAQPPAIGAQASGLTRDLRVGAKGSPSINMPKLLYGTAWKKNQTADLVLQALRTGFRGIDTAAQPKHYDEHAVGEAVRQAIAQGVVRREGLFIQTKFTAPGGQGEGAPYDMDAPLEDQVRQSVQSSLENFTIDGQEPYLDSVILHAPMTDMGDTRRVWSVLQAFVPDKIRCLGISNADTMEVYDLTTMMIPPAIVQNRFYSLTRFEVVTRKFCRDRGIIFQPFWTIAANEALVQSEPVAHVARKAGVELAVAYYSLVLGLGSLAILDGTTSEAHMVQDLEGIEKVGVWAEGDGAADWEAALADFKEMIGDAEWEQVVASRPRRGMHE